MYNKHQQLHQKPDRKFYRDDQNRQTRKKIEDISYLFPFKFIRRVIGGTAAMKLGCQSFRIFLTQLIISKKAPEIPFLIKQELILFI